MKIMAVDAASIKTGICVADAAEDDSYTLYALDTWKFPEKDELGHRAFRLYGRVFDWCRTYKPAFCAIEDGYVGPNRGTAIALAKVRMAVEIGARAASTPVVTLSPSTVKAAVAHGGASKAEVAVAVRALLGIGDFPDLDDNCTDAAALMIAAWHEYRARVTLTERRQ